MRTIWLYLTACVSLICSSAAVEAMQSNAGSDSGFTKTAASFDALRGRAGVQGQTVELIAGPASGLFLYIKKSKRLVDDGGTIVKAENGWWQRQFEYGKESPILLDWFELHDGSDLTPLLKKVARNYAPDLYLKLPEQIAHLEMNTINLSDYGILSLYLFEPESELIIHQGDRSKNPNILIAMNDYQHVYIGGENLNVTFRGLHDGVRGGHNAKVFGQNPEGLLSFNRKRRFVDNSFEFKANIEDSRVYGLDHRGKPSGHHRTPTVIVGGKFLNSGLRFNGGHKRVYLDNVWLSDPFAVALGWDGTRKINNGTKSGLPYYERSRGVSVVYSDSVAGSINLEFGRPRWFLSMVRSVGDGEASPFVVRYKDLGFTASGAKVSSRGFLDTGGKVDSLGSGTQRHFSFEELEHQFGYGLRHSVILEATSQDGDGGAQYYNQGVHMTLDGISRNVKTAHLDYIGDYSSHHHVTGSMAKCERQEGRVPIQPRLVIHHDDVVSHFKGCVIEFNFIQKLKQPAKNNTLDQIQFFPGGYLLVGVGSKNNTVKNVNFDGRAREVIKIMNTKKWRQAPIWLQLENIKAPKGSQIVAMGSDDFVITLDGESIDLPYTFE